MLKKQKKSIKSFNLDLNLRPRDVVIRSGSLFQKDQDMVKDLRYCLVYYNIVNYYEFS